MLESIVELLVGLFLIVLTLLIGSSIVGSIVAALRAVSHEAPGRRTARFSLKSENAFVSESRLQPPDGPLRGLHVKTF